MLHRCWYDLLSLKWLRHHYEFPQLQRQNRPCPCPSHRYLSYHRYGCLHLNPQRRS